MTSLIHVCKQVECNEIYGLQENGLSDAFGKVTLNKEELQAKTAELMQKILPFFKQSRQFTFTYQSSKNRITELQVFDLVLQAQSVRTKPFYCKKGSFSCRSLIVDEHEFFILLKSKGELVEKSSVTATRMTIAIKVPFATDSPASVVYQLVNSDSSPKLSLAELAARGKYSSLQCRRQFPCPRLGSLFSYVKNKDGMSFNKVTAFIESDSILCGFNPGQDRYRSDLFATSYDSWTNYVEDADIDSVRFLLDQTKDEKDPYVDAAIVQAVAGNHTEIVKMMVAKHIPENETWHQCLVRAIKSGNKEISKLLLEVYPDKEAGLTYAFRFALEEKREILEFVLSLGGIPAPEITRAIKQESKTERIELLVSLYADITQDAGDALYNAVLRVEWQKLAILIKKGANVKYIPENQHETVLMQVAAINEPESKDAILLLLEHGADPEVRSRAGLKAISIAALVENEPVVALLLERSQNKEQDEAEILKARGRRSRANSLTWVSSSIN